MDLCGVSDGHLNLYAGLDVDGGDLLDDLRGGMQVNDALVDSHLELVPGFGTLTARSLPGGNPEDLGWHPHWALNLQILVLWTGASSSTPFPSLYAAMILVELVTVIHQ